MSMTRSNRRDKDYLDEMTPIERKIWVKGIISRMMNAWGLTEHKEISKKLGLYENVPAGWIKNGGVPLHAAITCSQDTGVSLDWIYFDIKTQEPEFKVTPEIKEKLVNQANKSLITGIRINLISEKNNNGGNIFAQMLIDDLLPHINPPDKTE